MKEKETTYLLKVKIYKKSQIGIFKKISFDIYKIYDDIAIPRKRD